MHVEPYDLPAAGQKTVTGHGEEPAGVSGTLFLVLPPSGGALGRVCSFNWPVAGLP